MYPRRCPPGGDGGQVDADKQGDPAHSLEVIPFSDKLPPQAADKPAFSGAVTKNPQVGITKGQTATVEFTASAPGKYLLICGFPGHALLEMYGILEISPSATTKPRLVVKK